MSPQTAQKFGNSLVISFCYCCLLSYLDFFHYFIQPFLCCFHCLHLVFIGNLFKFLQHIHSCSCEVLALLLFSWHATMGPLASGEDILPCLFRLVFCARIYVMPFDILLAANISSDLCWMGLSHLDCCCPLWTLAMCSGSRISEFQTCVLVGKKLCSRSKRSHKRVEHG